MTGHIVPDALSVIDQIAKAKQASRLAYGEDIKSVIKRVLSLERSLTIQVRLDKVASRQDCWVCTR